MGWSQVAILLTLLFAVVTTQRGGRRYVADQPLEENLSVENHRFRSRSREDISGEVRRGDNRRNSAETSIESNPRLTRTRGRIDETKISLATSGRELTDNKQHILSRQTQEKRKFTSREEIQSTKFRSREPAIATEAPSSHSRSSGRAGSRTDSKETHSGIRGSRFPSRDTESQSVNNEPIRSRVGETQRGRTETNVRRGSNLDETKGSRRGSVQDETRGSRRGSIQDNSVGSRRGSVQDETRSSRRGDIQDDTRGSRRGSIQDDTRGSRRGSIQDNSKQPSPVRISTRGNSKQEQVTRSENTLEKTLETNTPISPAGNLDLAPKISGITERSQELSTGEINTSLSDAPASVNTIDDPINTVSTEGKLFENEDSKSSSQSAIVSTENAPEYPSKLNDVEESQRASRKLDIDTTESSHNFRGRPRKADENLRLRFPDSSTRRRGDNLEPGARSKELRGKIRGSEETSRHNNAGITRGNRVENIARTQGSEESSRFQSDERSSDFTRNSKFENLGRTHSTEDIVRNRNSYDKKVEPNNRHFNIADGRSRHQEGHSVRGQSEQRGRIKNTESRNRNNSGEQKNEDVLNNSDRNRFESINTRSRSPDLTKESEGPRRPFKYSAKIPATPELPNDDIRTNSKFKTRSRAKDLSNFRSRAKNEDNITTVKVTTPGKFTEGIPFLEPTVETQTEAKLQTNLIDAKNEVTLSEPTEGIITSSLRPLARSLNRQPINRARGSVKGPKLHDSKDNSEEVRDDDNYPEVYKQLKKSGTNPKEILVFPPSKK